MKTQHLIMLVAFLAVLAVPASAQDKNAEALAEAKNRYFDAEANYDREVKDWFDSEEARARKRGDRDGVVSIKSDRNAFEASHVVPDRLPRLISRRLDSAKTRLKRDYGSIVSNLTREGYDKRAADAEKELISLLSRENLPIDLFNGQDLVGWQGDPRLWRAANGVIVGMTPPNGLASPTYLFTTQTFTDFKLQCDLKLTGATADSGLMFRNVVVDPNQFLLAGPQCNIGPDRWGDFMIQGSRNGPFRSKSLKKADGTAIGRVLRPDDFNTVSIKCVGTQVTIALNGQELVDGQFRDIPESGVVGFQLYPNSPTTVQIKNVRIFNVRKSDEP